MESQHLSSPSNIRNQAYELAHKLACEQLASMNIEEICSKTGGQYVIARSEIPRLSLRGTESRSNLWTGSEQAEQSLTKIIIEYLNQSYLITFPDGTISLKDSEENVPLRDKVLILHYLTLAKGTPATNKFITFKQLPGCASYFSVFQQLAIKPLLNHFGKEPELLIDAAAKLGGHKANYGDVAITINAFPRVPITVALWRGDDEFAPRGSIMFDSTVSDYLSAEDVRELCGIIARKLVKNIPSPLM